MDGARVQKKSGGKPGPAVWVPAAILAVLLAAYLGLCGWVSASDTILPNVTAAGLDLSGMTQAEACLSYTSRDYRKCFWTVRLSAGAAVPPLSN